MIFVNDIQTFDQFFVGPRVSDHAFCQCTLSLSLLPDKGHHVYDFKNIYDNFTESLITHFDSINIFTIFSDCSLDGLSDQLTEVILQAWKNFGIVKFINKKSRPWFIPEVKSDSSDSGFWKKRCKLLIKGGKTSGKYRGRKVTVDECRKKWKSAKAKSVKQGRALRVRSDNFVCRLADKDCHKVLSKIFRDGHRQIPTLKRKNKHGTFEIIATTDQEKADVLNKKFFNNTVLPDTFNTNLQSDKHFTDDISPFLGNYYFTDSGFLRHRWGLGTYALTTEDIHFINELGSVSWDSCKSDYLDSIEPCEDYISLREVRYVRENLKKGIGSTRVQSDTGWDANFNNDHIRKVNSRGLDNVLKLVGNAIFHFRYFPDAWRSATIVALAKAGISHVHQGGKFMEMLIFYRLRYVAVTTISKFQSGGRARCGSVQQLIRIIEDIQVYMNQDKPTRN